MSSPRDEREPAPAPFSADKELDELRRKFQSVEKSRDRFASRTAKLQADLDEARAQVAWFHRQLFGQKAERISKTEIEAAFRKFLDEQEARARGDAGPPRPEVEDELASVQLLMDLAPGQEAPQARSGGDELSKKHTQTPGRDAGAAPPTPPSDKKTKRKGHGRKQIPPSLREETVVIEPDEIPQGARQVGAEVSYRVGMRRPELVRFAIVRPKYAVDSHDESTKIVVAEPPHEMIPRGLFAPSGLAHIIASRHDRSVPYSRLKRFFADGGYSIPVSTLSGVGMRAVSLVNDLLKAMTAHAQDVAPYLAIDATGVLLQQPKRCLRGHVWMRYVEDVCVLVSFTKRHDSESASEQLDGWSCPTLADGAQVFDAKHRETNNPRAGCWAHGRRKLVYAAPTDGRSLVGIKLT